MSNRRFDFEKVIKSLQSNLPDSYNVHCDDYTPTKPCCKKTGSNCSTEIYLRVSPTPFAISPGMIKLPFQGIDLDLSFSEC